MTALEVVVVDCDFSFPTEKTPSSFASNCRCWPLLIVNGYKGIISLKKPPRFKLTAEFPFLDQKLRWTEPRRMANLKC